MNILEPRMPELALLRDLPPEVSLAQVEQWVALFPPAPPPKPWYRNINLNTIIMTTASAILVGGLLYFLSADPATPPPATQALPPPAPAMESAPAPSDASEPAASLAPATTPPPRISPAPAADPAPDAPVAFVDTISSVPPPMQLPEPAAASPPPPSAAPLTASANERRFDLSGFTRVVLLGSLDMEVHQGPFSVVAIGAPEELERIQASVNGDMLKVRNKDYVRWFEIGRIEPVKLVVHMPDLTAFDLDGSGSAMMHSFSGQEKVLIRLLGSGDIVMQSVQDVGELRVVLSGSGNVLLERFAGPGAIELSVRGSGDIEALALQDLSALQLDMQGSGRIICRDAVVKGRTDVDLSGGGHIVVAGSTTQLDVSLTGSGDVQAGAFAAERGSAELIGSGNAKVNFTTDQVSTTVVGSGVLKRVGGSDRKE